MPIEGPINVGRFLARLAKEPKKVDLDVKDVRRQLGIEDGSARSEVYSGPSLEAKEAFDPKTGRLDLNKLRDLTVRPEDADFFGKG